MGNSSSMIRLLVHISFESLMVSKINGVMMICVGH